MDSCPPESKDALRADVRLIRHAIFNGASSSRAKLNTTAWRVWCKFCATINLDPSLQHITDKVFYLCLFALHYRTGQIAPKGNPVKTRCAEDAVRQVGQTFAQLDPPTPATSAMANWTFA